MNTEVDADVTRRANSPDLLSAAALFVGVLGNIAVAGLALDNFAPLFTLGAALFLTVGILLVWLLATHQPSASWHQTLIPRKPDPVLPVSLVLGGLLRWKPANFLQGGQDQGLYVNMAAALQKWGQLRFPDSARKSLSAAAQQLYDMTALSSYYTVDKVRSTSFIEFYPLHPALMAVSSAVVGGTGKFSMTMMALLGIWAGWRLALEIDGRRLCAGIFAVLIAVNPALVFFAKFPVSETTALTFTLIGFLFLLRGARSTTRPDRLLNLVVSVLAFNSLFYVRWQFLLYLPFMFLLLAGSWVVRGFRAHAPYITSHVLTTVGLFVLSFVFYKSRMPELYSPVMDSITEMLPSVRVLLAAGIITVLGGLLARIVFKWHEFEIFRSQFDRRSGQMYVATVAFSALSILHLYRGKSMYPWGYATPSDSDPWVVRFHVLFRLAQFVSPWILVLVVVSAVLARPRSITVNCLYLFTATCWAGILLRPFVPYLYYYGRYLVVDAMPATLLLGSISITSLLTKHSRVIGAALLALTVAYSSFFSVVQWGHSEGEDDNFYFGIASVVKKSDILVVSSTSQQVIVPLRAYFGLTVLAVPDQVDGAPTAAEVLSLLALEVKRTGGDLYYLGGESSPVTGSRSVGVFPFTDTFISNSDHFREGGVSNTSSLRRLALPSEWVSNSFNWELYKLDRNG